MITRSRDLFDIMDDLWGRNTSPYMTKTGYELVKSKVDVYSNDKSYFIRVELPGLSKSDVSIKCENSVLTISGEKKNTQPVDTTCSRQECAYGSFTRTFDLPANITSNDISAKMENGVLEITITKPEAKKPKSIDIKIT